MPETIVEEKTVSSQWRKEHILTADSYNPIEVARLTKYKWPYTEVGLHIEGLAWEAKEKGKEILCIDVDYCGTVDREGVKCHHARCTTYLATGLCRHDNIKECIEGLEKWRVGPCYPKRDSDAEMIFYMTEKLRNK